MQGPTETPNRAAACEEPKHRNQRLSRARCRTLGFFLAAFGLGTLALDCGVSQGEKDTHDEGDDADEGTPDSNGGSIDMQNGPDASNGAGNGAPNDSTAGPGSGQGSGSGSGSDVGGSSSSGSPGGRKGCDTGSWTTYGHDNARTFSSPGCVAGELRTAWRQPPFLWQAGSRVQSAFSAVATAKAIALNFAYAAGQREGYQAVDTFGADGTHGCGGTNGRDLSLGGWSTITNGGQVLANDDGYTFYDAKCNAADTGGMNWDTWGQTIAAGDVIYVSNASSDDGPPLMVGAFDLAGHSSWVKLTGGIDFCHQPGGHTCPTKGTATDLNGGPLALDGGTLFYAPRYQVNVSTPEPLQSGMYALDPASGGIKWFKAGDATSAISAGNGMVFVASGNTLLALNQSDGSRAWSADGNTISRQAPVLADGKVIIADETGIKAFDQAKGSVAWTAPITNAVAHQAHRPLRGVAADYNVWTMYGVDGMGRVEPSSTMAAAEATKTLVVTALDAVYVLSLADGKQLWKGQPAQATGRLREPIIVGSRVYAIDNGPDNAPGTSALMALDAL